MGVPSNNGGRSGLSTMVIGHLLLTLLFRLKTVVFFLGTRLCGRFLSDLEGVMYLSFSKMKFLNCSSEYICQKSQQEDNWHEVPVPLFPNWSIAQYFLGSLLCVMMYFLATRATAFYNGSVAIYTCSSCLLILQAVRETESLLCNAAQNCTACCFSFVL